MRLATRAMECGLVACHTCGLVCAAASDQKPAACLRCGSKLHQRFPDSVSRSWALLFAAVMMYIPANLLPVMNTTLLGRGSDSTIMSGVIQFWEHGSYGISALIFIASIAVPCTKFLILALLLVTSSLHSAWRRHERARLYRLIELVGYWSMLDVLVVAVIAALVKFNALSDAEPRIGILFFGSVVILTMLSAMNFDPRLIWDDKND
jgi:paraquat-inducible protein A